MFHVLICDSDEEIRGVFLQRVRKIFDEGNEPVQFTSGSSWKKCLISCDNLEEINLFIFNIHAEETEWEGFISTMTSEVPEGIVLLVFDSKKKFLKLFGDRISSICRNHRILMMDIQRLGSEVSDSTIRHAIKLSRKMRKSHLEITHERRHWFLDPSDIIYCEICQKMLMIYCRSAHIFKTRMKLRTAEQRLSDQGFLRIHKSYLVNLNAIVSFSAEMLSMQSGEHLPIGRKYRKKAVSVIKERNKDASKN